MRQSIPIASIPTWKKIALYAGVAILLMLVFALYFIPEVVIGLAEQAWALCGW